MATARIGRGLFRLWLVLSIAWIGAVGTMMWPWKPPFDPNKPFEVVPSSAASGAGMFDDLVPKPKKRVLSDAEFQAALPDAPWATKPQFDPSEFAAFKLTAQRKTTAEVALIPPILLLLIGSALGWAIRGFRS